MPECISQKKDHTRKPYTQKQIVIFKEHWVYKEKMVCCFEATLGDKKFEENIKPISVECCYYVETILLSCSVIILLNQSCYYDIIQCSYYLETNQWTGFFVMEALG